jgi:probable addiction module antidote protein
LVLLQGEIIKKTLSYQEQLIERLRDPEYSLAYLNECLKDNDPRVFLSALLRHVIEAQCGGLAEASKRTKLNKENLYRMLSDQGNPQIASVYKLLHCIGWKLQVQPDSNA